MSNIVYSYYRSDNAQTDPFLLDIKPTVMKLLHKMIPVELCQVLRAYIETGHFDEQMEVRFQEEFKGRYEMMKPVDIAVFYYCYTKLGFKGDGMFYKYL